MVHFFDVAAMTLFTSYWRSSYEGVFHHFINLNEHLDLLSILWTCRFHYSFFCNDWVFVTGTIDGTAIPPTLRTDTAFTATSTDVPPTSSEDIASTTSEVVPKLLHW